LAALAPRPGELLWDVGAGSGTVSVEWCLSWRDCAGVAFERDAARRRNIGSNAAAFGVSIDVRGAAPDAFDGAEAPSAIFIGGGLTQPGLLDASLDKLPSGGRLVANAVTAESESILAQAYSGVGGQLRRFQHYRGEPLGGRLAPAEAGHPMGGDTVTVYFIGAGPGAADLITVRGQRLLERCTVCLYAGSIMPDDLLALCPPDAKIVDTGPLTLKQIIAELADAHAAGRDVARLHSGDPSLYSALAEQCRRLDALGIEYEIVPGVPAFAAAAAALKRELTVPGVAQTVTLTRVATLSTPMPPGEELAALAQSGATLVLHLAAAQIDAIIPQLIEGGYRPETPAAVVAFATWPQQTVLRGALGGIAAQMHDANITKTAVIIVGDVLAAEGFTDSYLYSAGRIRGSGH
jgi:precorrin-4/cobalt-precorrin-4 C11-methyltransferase